MKTIIEAVKQMHKNSEGKTSAKRVWGGISLTCALLTYLMDGFDFYNINEHLFDSLLIASSTLLGLDIAEHFKKRTNDKLTKDTE